MSKRILLTLVGVLTAFSLVACSGEEKKAESSAPATKDSGYKVAYLTPSMDIPFWRYIAKGVETKAKALGAKEVQVYDSKDSADTQLKNAQDAIVKQVDAIVISPIDSASCPAVLSLAEENNVPVVICDIGTDSGKFEAFVITDNKKGAFEIGEYVASKLNEGDKVAQVTLNQARNNGKLRKAGFEEGIAAKKLNQVDFRQMEKHNRQEGESFTQDLVTAYPDVKAIFVHADDPSMGALSAVTSSAREDIMIAGFDCTPEMVDSIKAGKLVGTSAQQPVLMGEIAAEQVAKILKGEKVDKQIDVSTLLVTKDNVGETEAILYKTAIPKE